MSEQTPPGVDAYASYVEWKRWDGAFQTSDKEARYLAAEFQDIPLRGRRVLEVGFGNGAFLAWAKQQGADVAGIELHAEMLEAARRQGFVALKNSLATLRWNHGGRNVCSATSQRGGKITKSMFATPTVSEGEVSTVKIDGSG